MPRRSSLFAALFGLSLIWGGSFFFIKTLLNDFGPWTIAFFRSTLGLATITTIMLLLRQPFGFRKIKWVPMATMALINTAIPWAIIGFSETRLTSSMASVLNATTPIWTVIVGMAFFKAATNRFQWLGMGIGLVGLFLLVGVNPVSIISVDPLGLVGMLVASFAYAVGSRLSKRLAGGLSMYQLTFGTLLSAMLGSGILAFALEPISFARLTVPTNLAVAIGLGVFGSGVAYILFYYMVQNGGPEFATMVTYIVPAMAILWGHVLLNEPIEWSMLSGLVLILGGVFVANQRGATTPKGVRGSAVQ